MKRNIKRGEIYWVELDPIRGSEIRKTRPCLIISNDEQNEISRRVMVISLTTSQNLPLVPFHVNYIFQNRLAKILPEQMRVADKSRIRGKCLEGVSSEVIEKVEKAINLVLGMKIG